MMASTHVLTAATAARILLDPSPNLIFVCVIESLIPNITMPESRFGRLVPMLVR